MPALPIHNDEVSEGSEKPRWADSHPRPSRNTMIWRYFVVVSFLVGYYLLLRPTEALSCTSLKCYISRDTADCSAKEASREMSFEADKSQRENLEKEHFEHSPASQRPLAGSTAPAEIKIPLEAHIMSKCPDAKDCLQMLVLPAMEKISDKVDFKLSFIARQASQSSACCGILLTFVSY